MITCHNCGKDNQDHYKFCLACGTKLPAAGPGPSPAAVAPAPAPPSPGTPPAPPARGAPAPGQPGAPQPPSGPVGAGPPPSVAPPPMTGQPAPLASSTTAPGNKPSPAAGADARPCPSCAFMNPQGFKFCGRCGATLIADAPAPTGGNSGGGRPQSVKDMGSAQTIFVADAKDMDFSKAPPEPEEHTSEGPVVPVVPAGGAGRAPPRSNTAMGSGPTATSGGPAAIKLIMLGPDGQPVGERVLAAGESLEIGRACGPPWEDDAYLDPQHARLSVMPDGVELEDNGSLNGVFLKLRDRVEVHDGDQFRVGQELLLYEDLPEPTPTDDGTERMGSPNPGYWGRLSVLVDPDHPSVAFPVEGDGIVIGRESGDITFPQDGYVSGEHCRLIGDDSGVYMEDVGSSNGTYMRVRTGTIIPYGSLILVGQKLFQVEQAD